MAVSADPSLTLRVTKRLSCSVRLDDHLMGVMGWLVRQSYGIAMSLGDGPAAGQDRHRRRQDGAGRVRRRQIAVQS